MIQRVAGKELGELLNRVPESSWMADASSVVASTIIDSITPDSRKCRPGTMFVAIPGTRVDGTNYIADAVHAGASCVVARSWRPEAGNVPFIISPDPRRFLSLISQAFFDFPARRMAMIGITGTSGKTSTAYMIRRMLDGVGEPSVMIGTTGYLMPDGQLYPPDALPATTPEPFALNWYLDTGIRAGARIAVLEVSSFALAYERVFGMQFDCAVFTNFSEDHLGYHGSMQEYMAAKQRLFHSMENRGVAVLNRDDPAYEAFREAAGTSTIVAYSSQTDADLEATKIVSDGGITRFDVRAADGDEARVTLSVGPAYQASNCLAAIGAVRSILPGRKLEELTRPLCASLYIPGRYERIDCGQPYEVVVDYAHTPEEFAALFAAVRETIRGDMIAVFGSVGADDRKKRPLMAAIAERECTWSYVTVEDPRGEDAGIAIRDIVAGFSRQCFTIIEDRRRAIREAIAAAQPGDAVLILGRGHETIMYYESGEVILDDRVEARNALRESGYIGCTCDEKRNEEVP